jgi:hypothetical protein
MIEAWIFQRFIGTDEGFQAISASVGDIKIRNLQEAIGSCFDVIFTNLKKDDLVKIFVACGYIFGTGIKIILEKLDNFKT